MPKIVVEQNNALKVFASNISHPHSSLSLPNNQWQRYAFVLSMFCCCCCCLIPFSQKGFDYLEGPPKQHFFFFFAYHGFLELSFWLGLQTVIVMTLQKAHCRQLAVLSAMDSSWAPMAHPVISQTRYYTCPSGLFVELEMTRGDWPCPEKIGRIL